MKTLTDGTKVTARTYYYLLDFNERYEWRFIADNFKKGRLCDLTLNEYIQLFEHATKTDSENLKLLR